MAGHSRDMWAIVRYKKGGDIEVVHVREISIDKLEVTKDGRRNFTRTPFTPKDASSNSFDKEFWYTVKTSLRCEGNEKLKFHALIGRLGYSKTELEANTKGFGGRVKWPANKDFTTFTSDSPASSGAEDLQQGVDRVLKTREYKKSVAEVKRKQHKSELEKLAHKGIFGIAGKDATKESQSSTELENRPPERQSLTELQNKIPDQQSLIELQNKIKRLEDEKKARDQQVKTLEGQLEKERKAAKEKEQRLTVSHEDALRTILETHAKSMEQRLEEKIVSAVNNRLSALFRKCFGHSRLEYVEEWINSIPQ